MPTAFLDRDGTINREVDFLGSPEQLELLPGALEAVQRRAPVHRLQVLVAVAEIQTNGVLPALVGLQLVAFGVTAKALGGEVVGNPVDPTINLPVGQPLVAPR